MRDYIELCTTTPFDEKCAQLGEDNYMQNARIEAHAYINQLIRVHGENPEGTNFRITQNPHDFGMYLDIRFDFDEEIEMHLYYMHNIESGLPLWDMKAKLELNKAGYKIDRKDNLRSLNQRAA